jgi:hypothetical protein
MFFSSEKSGDSEGSSSHGDNIGGGGITGRRESVNGIISEFSINTSGALLNSLNGILISSVGGNPVGNISDSVNSEGNIDSWNGVEDILKVLLSAQVTNSSNVLGVSNDVWLWEAEGGGVSDGEWFSFFESPEVHGERTEA